MRSSVLLGLLAFTLALPATAAAQSEPIDPVTEAVMLQDASKVAALLAAGGDANAVYNQRSALGWAAQAGSLEIVTLLMALSDGDAALITAVLDAGADPNVKTSFGTPALIVAIESALAPEIIALLLAREADVNARDSYDQTPLHAAARAGNLAAVTALIGAGADVNATLGSGETPLQTARYSAAPDEVVAALLAAGARE